MINKRIVISIVGITIIGVIVVLVTLFLGTREGSTQEVSVGPSGDGRTLVENHIDNYTIIVGKDWDIPETVSSSDNLLLRYKPNEHLWLSILTLDNLEGLPLSEWLRIAQRSNSFFSRPDPEISGERLYKWEGKLYKDDFDADGNPVEIPVENSATTIYLLSAGNTIYSLSCGAFGKEAMRLISSCEEIMLSFETTVK